MFDILEAFPQTQYFANNCSTSGNITEFVIPYYVL